MLGVNRNTVLRALRLLRDEGLLEFRRGRGVTVAGTPQRGAVLAQARSLVRFAAGTATAVRNSSRSSSRCPEPGVFAATGSVCGSMCRKRCLIIKALPG